MPLSAADIQNAFSALSNELALQNERAEIVVVGGAALVLLFQARDSTKDVDALFVRPEAARIREAAARVAADLELPSDWLNDGAKGYLVGVSTGKVLYQSNSLVARAASTEQLLAMKLAAWRDAVDRSDAMLLLSHIEGPKDATWAAVAPYVPSNEVDKASYAFDDLWELLHGPE